MKERDGMNMPKRNRSVSVMKGIGIFCVVLGHASLTRYLSPLIRVIQLPIFWWVAGWTFDYSKYGKNCWEQDFINLWFRIWAICFF